MLQKNRSICVLSILKYSSRTWGFFLLRNILCNVKSFLTLFFCIVGGVRHKYCRFENLGIGRESRWDSSRNNSDEVLHLFFHTQCSYHHKLVKKILTSVADPDLYDPYVFGSPGSGSICQRSGSGSLCHQAIKVRKSSHCFVTSFWLFIFEK